MLHKPFAALTCLALFAAAGCVVVENDPPTYYGTLDTLWTLDGSNDPSICAYYGVDRVDIAVYDTNGDFVVDARPICEDFGVSFEMPDAGYDVEITLLDPGGNALSDTQVVGVDVWADEITILEIDFPDASIY